MGLWKTIMEANSRPIAQVSSKWLPRRCPFSPAVLHWSEPSQLDHHKEWPWILVQKLNNDQPPPLHGWHQSVCKELNQISTLNHITRIYSTDIDNLFFYFPGCPNKIVKTLQLTQNAAACVITRTNIRDHTGFYSLLLYQALLLWNHLSVSVQ